MKSHPALPPGGAGDLDATDSDGALAELRWAVLAHVRHALADVDRVECRVGRRGHDDLVSLTGPPITEMRRRALAVRVLDAVRAVGRTYGHVDVVYQSAPEQRA
jgi:hypothetical protein